jgi:hypothetical protein
MGCDATSGNGILQDVTMKLKPKFCRLNSKGQKGQKMEESAVIPDFLPCPKFLPKSEAGRLAPRPSLIGPAIALDARKSFSIR